jgi:uncharacterized repeat protein (TIGR03847 family)
LSLSWDPSTAQVVIEAYPIEEENDILDEASPEAAEMVLVRIPVGTARAFAKRTGEVVGAGRPLCPLCGEPVDVNGHTCTLPGV